MQDLALPISPAKEVWRRNIFQLGAVILETAVSTLERMD
jgi:hypothetical protein